MRRWLSSSIVFRRIAGFIVLTGEVGTGKTTLLHALIQRLDGDTEVAFIPFSLLSFDEILTYMLNILGVPRLRVPRCTGYKA